MRLTPWAIALAAVAPLAAVAVTAAPAAAYPQFQLSTGASRCQECHLSPAGGGLLSDYGRSEAGDTVAGRGSGELLHGLWTPPSWFQIGGDYRGAGAYKRVGGRNEWLGFPMQADLYLYFKVKSVSLHVTAGGRPSPRDGGGEPSIPLASREHYAMWQPSSTGPYVRVGRFFPVFGVRSQDHTAYVRRFLDQYILEEPYGVGAGYLTGAWEAHATAFVPSPVPYSGAGPRAMGVAAYVERRLRDDTAALGGQARVAHTGDDDRYLVGAVGKLWLDGSKLMLLGELDLQLQTFSGTDGQARAQVAWYAGVTRMALPGLMIGGAIHRWEPDLTLSGSARDAVELNVQYFPYAHVELHLLGRVAAEGLDWDHPSALTLLQLHYFL